MEMKNRRLPFSNDRDTGETPASVRPRYEKLRSTVSKFDARKKNPAKSSGPAFSSGENQTMVSPIDDSAIAPLSQHID